LLFLYLYIIFHQLSWIFPIFARFYVANHSHYDRH